MEVLITGGSEGIGLGLAERFLRANHRVMVTGRDINKLQKAVSLLPGLEIFVNDIGEAQQREILFSHVKENMPGLNFLINNAGVQRRVALAADHGTWEERQAEINILLSGPIHLNHLLIPLLLEQNKTSCIVNVTSGGAYIPQVFAPIYSACKAALHHYTIILRESLRHTTCKVIELVPPAIQTALAGHGMKYGVSVAEFCEVVFPQLVNGNHNTIGFGPTAHLKVELSGSPLDDLFQASSERFPVQSYS